MIDWNKAPEDATHYVARLSAFYKVYDGVLMIYSQTLMLDKWSESGYKDIPELSEEYCVVERPKQLVDTPKKHIHYNLIMQWASDPSQNIWFRKLNNKWHKWQKCTMTPCWDTELEYHIGDNSPRETIRIGEFDVPKPLASHELVDGQLYHYPLVHLAGKESGKFYYLRLMGNCINLHLTKEDALLHSEALRSLIPS